MVDIHKPGDYRIILGDSLKDGHDSLSHIAVKYNWIPKTGFDNSSGNGKGGDKTLTAPCRVCNVNT